MPDLEPITRDEKLWSGEDLEPITRREMYIKHLYDETQVIPDKPITREEMFILKAGEELHDVTIEQLTATENKTYSEEGVAYSPVIVNVPQTTLTTLDVTENGTYTAPSGTAYNEVDVDVPLPDNAYLLKEIEDVEIASFNDGASLPMPKLEIAVEPQQDLHGYDAPWVGGAGKNKLPMTVDGIKGANTSGTWSGNVYTYNGGTFEILVDSDNNVIGIKFNTTTNITHLFNLYSGDLSAFSNMIMNGAIDGNNGKFIRLNVGSTNYDDRGTGVNIGTVSGNGSIYIALYNQQSGTFQPMIRLATENDPTFVPYSNECPISGWSAVEVTNMDDISDKAFFDGLLNGTYGIVDLGTLDWQYSSISERFYVSASDLGVKATDVSTPFNAISSALIAKSYNEIEAKTVDNAIGINPNATQLFARYSSITSASAFITAMNGVHLIYELATPTTPTITPSELNALYAEFGINGSTITIQLGSTYYGGKLDVVSGVLTVTHKSLNLGDQTWKTVDSSGGVNRFYVELNDMKSMAIRSMDILCSCYKTNVGGGVFDDSTIYNTPTPTRIMINTSQYSDAMALKNSLSGQTAVYELATPLTIQLTPTQVSSLLGSNNIWADCGDIIDGQYFGKEV